MSCVVLAARSAVLRRFIWLYFGVVLLGAVALPARANEIDTSAAQLWCVIRGGEQPDCTFDSLIACGVKALLTTGYCAKSEPGMQAATPAEPAPVPRQRRPPRRKLATAHNDELFSEFMKWKEAGGR